jgi:phosphotriesterase-related protein
MSIITVNGKVKKEDLGITLPHEHLFLDMSFYCKDSEDVNIRELSKQKVNLDNLYFIRRNPFSMRDNFILSNEDLITSEVLEFKKAGGSTIIDLTTIGLSRSPISVRNVSNLTGINIILGCGYYISSSLPNYILEKPESVLVKDMLKEIYYGVENTNIKPGVIGEIGMEAVIEDWDKKILKAIVKVQKETCFPIFIHIAAVPFTGFTGKLEGLKVIDILEKNGANLEKVVICHTDAQIDLNYIKKILSSGAYIEFDHFNEEFYIESCDFIFDRDIDRVKAIKALIEDGYIKRILISQDICIKTNLISFGGGGYAYILNYIVPIMLKRGIGRESVDTIMIENPKELLDIRDKYL